MTTKTTTKAKTKAKTKIRNNSRDVMKKNVLDSVRAATQPVALNEITQRLAIRHGREYSKQWVHQILADLVKAGVVFSRPQTPAEAEVRGERVYNYVARLYWAGGSDIPERTEKNGYTNDTIPAVIARAISTGWVDKSVRPAERLIQQTDSLEIFTLKMRVLELETQLSLIKKILG